MTTADAATTSADSDSTGVDDVDTAERDSPAEVSTEPTSAAAPDEPTASEPADAAEVAEPAEAAQPDEAAEPAEAPDTADTPDETEQPDETVVVPAPKPAAPKPGAPRPGPKPSMLPKRPANVEKDAPPAIAVEEPTGVSAWGRVDESGAVYVRDGDDERLVGEYPDGTPAEALAYFERKYADLSAQITLLEQRASRGAPPADIARAVKRLNETVEDVKAVGDLEALRNRLIALGGVASELTAKQSEEHKAEVEASRVLREAIVVEAETLAARDPSTVQWKATTATMDALFARWQEAQKSPARIPKGEANDLWRRFRAARSTIDTARRGYFSELDSTQKGAREAKEALVERAEKLIPEQERLEQERAQKAAADKARAEKSRGTTPAPTAFGMERRDSDRGRTPQRDNGPDPIGSYRALMDEWKLVGRAGRKVDDALWERFRAAGDALYAVKSAAIATQDEEYAENLTAKLALLDEAEPLLKATDQASARNTLANIQLRWEAIGRVPRDQTKAIEDRLRRIETSVKNLEQEHWRRSNPETKARSEGLAGQLNSAIAKLEVELAAAKQANDKRAIKSAEEALAARRIWLDALGD